MTSPLLPPFVLDALFSPDKAAKTMTCSENSRPLAFLFFFQCAIHKTEREKRLPSDIAAFYPHSTMNGKGKKEKKTASTPISCIMHPSRSLRARKQLREIFQLKDVPLGSPIVRTRRPGRSRGSRGLGGIIVVIMRAQRGASCS